MYADRDKGTNIKHCKFITKKTYNIKGVVNNFKQDYMITIVNSL